MDTALPVPLAHRAFELGVHHQSAGEAAAAAAYFRQSVGLRPDFAEAWVNLGLLHDGAGDQGEALDCLQRAAALAPALPEAALNLGNVLARLRRFDEAEAAYLRAAALRPDSPAVWSNLGAMLSLLHRDDDALDCLRHALSLDPQYRGARFNLGYLLLRQGRLAEGFLCLEAREGTTEHLSRMDLPRWHGEDLRGRSLLVINDAGHGDLIQMCRYAGLLRDRGVARLLVCGQPALKRLLEHNALFDQVLGYDEPLPACDLWVPLMSLPFLCGTRLDNLPNRVPYLRAPPDRVAHWRDLLAPASEGEGRTLRVGLVWRGNPRNDNDADRSLPRLGVLAPLGQVPGVRFFSLQCGAGADEAHAPPAGLPLEQLPEPLGDFAETAAIVSQLDLLIGVDTSTLHLAAAVGTPAWVLLPEYKTDWRWLDARSDSPWYPGLVRLFRQRRAGDWAPVVADVADALHRLRAA